MNKPLVIAGVVVGVGVVGWMAFQRLYAMPAAKLREKLTGLEDRADGFQVALAQGAKVRSELRKFGAEAVGGPLDLADHDIRASLMELVGRSGIRQASIETGSPSAPANPYTRARRVRSPSMQRALRSQRDFYVIDARIRGVATLEQALRTVALLQGQPWIGRVTEWSLDVRGEDRKNFQFGVAVEVLYLPDIGAKQMPELVESDDALREVWEPIAAKNVFRYEPPVVVKADPPPQPPKPPPTTPQVPPPPPYHEWRVTGITEEVGASAGVRVTVTKVGAAASLTLAVGQQVLGATLVSGGFSEAVFEIEGAKFEVALGETLAQRRPVP